MVRRREQSCSLYSVHAPEQVCKLTNFPSESAQASRIHGKTNTFSEREFTFQCETYYTSLMPSTNRPARRKPNSVIQSAQSRISNSASHGRLQILVKLRASLQTPYCVCFLVNREAPNSRAHAGQRDVDSKYWTLIIAILTPTLPWTERCSCTPSLSIEAKEGR